MPTKNTTTAFGAPDLPERFADLAGPLHLLAQDAVDGITDSETDTDTFGPLASAAAFMRSAPVSEGAMLEEGLRVILQACGHFILFTDVSLPISEAARQAVRSNDPKSLAGIGLESAVYAAESYRADVLVVDRRSDKGYIVELKRCTTNYSGSRMASLQETLLAAALQAQDVLWRQHNRTITKSMRVLILDCADKDPRGEVVRLSDLDKVLDVAGLAAAIQFLRRRFGQAVRSAFAERFGGLLAANLCEDPEPNPDAPKAAMALAINTPPGPESDRPPFRVDVGFAGAARC